MNRIKYPKPDISALLKSMVGMAASLVFLHWIPDTAIWVHANFFNERLVIDQRSYKMVLFVAYAIAGIATTIGVAGTLWAAWHNRKDHP